MSDDAVLLQMKSSASLDVSSNHAVFAQLSALQGRYNQLAAGDADPPATDELKKAISTFKGEVKSFLDDEHNQDTGLFADEKAKHAKCISNFQKREEGDVKTAGSTRTTAANNHRNCRKSEKTWLTYRQVVQTCGADLSSTHTIPQECDDICTLRDKAKQDANQLVGSHDCSVQQTQQEQAFCAYRSAKANACSGLTSCVGLVNLVGFASTMQSHADSRRLLWQQLLMLECKVDKLNIVDYKDGTQQGMECTPQAVDNLFVMDTSFPSSPTCSSVPLSVFPSEGDCAAWITQEYNWESTAHVLPTSCESSCSEIKVEYEVAENCKDDNAEECPFYKHHIDACGKYDSDGFLAKEHCCSCGGGTTPTTTTATTTMATTTTTSTASSQIGDPNCPDHPPVSPDASYTGARCPDDYPYAYRPLAGFDYCCATAGDNYTPFNPCANGNADRSKRHEGCKDAQYVQCPTVGGPCSDAR